MTGAPDAPATPLFTVFTGTRNRAHTLPRVYDSLRQQTFRDFEWLIVDNESTDGTRELVEGWQAQSDFPIRYLWHENRGKHGSQNRAVGEAHGQLFLTLDSDDPCAANALERFSFHWHAIHQNGVRIGDLTNCVWSQRLKHNIGFALVASACKEGDRVVVHKEGQQVPGTLQSLPFI